MIEDKQLICQFATERSEEAFSELVRRHLKMVYAAALRQVNGDSQLAEDVTQTVFTDLGRKARKLENAASIVGWLYNSTRFAAANAVRTETRRRAREQTALTMNELHSNPTDVWNELRPVIDEALGDLGQTDREAVVLRYFESYEFSLVGAALGVSESGARMRVERALEKLRAALQKRGVTTTGAALAAALVNSSIGAVPLQLATVVTRAVLSHATEIATGPYSSTLKILVMTKLKLTVIGLLVLAATALLVVKNTSSHSSPSVRKSTAKINASLHSGETLVTGGWRTADGKNMMIFLTSVDNGASGVLSSLRLIAVPDAGLETPDWSAFKVTSDGRNSARAYPNAQADALCAQMSHDTGSEVISRPRVNARFDQPASVAIGNQEMIAGKQEFIGLRVDVLATHSADAGGMNLDVSITDTRKPDEAK